MSASRHHQSTYAALQVRTQSRGKTQDRVFPPFRKSILCIDEVPGIYIHWCQYHQTRDASGSIQRSWGCFVRNRSQDGYSFCELWNVPWLARRRINREDERPKYFPRCGSLLVLPGECSYFHLQLVWELAPQKPFWLWIPWRSSRFGFRPSNIPLQIQWRHLDIAMQVMPSIPLFEKKVSWCYIGASPSLLCGKLPTKVPTLPLTRRSRNCVTACNLILLSFRHINTWLSASFQGLWGLSQTLQLIPSKPVSDDFAHPQFIMTFFERFTEGNCNSWPISLSTDHNYCVRHVEARGLSIVLSRYNASCASCSTRTGNCLCCLRAHSWYHWKNETNDQRGRWLLRVVNSCQGT